MLKTYSTESNAATKENNAHENSEDVKEEPLHEFPFDEEVMCKQIEEEYQLGWKFTEPKRAEGLRRLKLFNNQARQKDKVGDPLLFTVFQTVFSSLYEDKLSVSWEGNEEGDRDTAENLTALAEHDHRVMHKAEIDHDWDWDTCFFGRGLVLLSEFDRSEGVMAPIPEVIDPLMWIRDPRATSVNGDMRGRGAMRFGGREINMTLSEMKDIPGFKNLDKLKKNKASDNVTDEVRQERRAAQGTDNLSTFEEALTENYEFNLLEWFTVKDGKKCIVTLGNDRKVVVRYQVIESPWWPILDRPLFPIAHDWDGVSIPDLIEDKQRARAKLINLGLEGAVADLYPMYLYNKKKIRNKRDLDFAFNKAVGVDGDTNNVFAPMNKSQNMSVAVEAVLGMLDVAAQKAVAAPEIAQGVTPSNNRTLGENELVAASRGARMNLAARIWGWSEIRFWNQWYWLYKKHFKEDIDEKVVRLKGTLATSWRTLTRENIIGNIDPDVFVESKREADARRQRDSQEFSAFTQIILQDPTVNRRYALRRLGRISARLKSDEIMLLFPPTADELQAEDENKLLEDNQYVDVGPNDDDIIHMEKHRDIQSTPAVVAHIQAHKMMMLNKRDNPMAFAKPQVPGEEGMGEFSPITTPKPVEEPITSQ